MSTQSSPSEVGIVQVGSKNVCIFLKLTVQQRGRFGMTITAVSFCVCCQVRLYDCLPAADFLKHVIPVQNSCKHFPLLDDQTGCPTTHINVCRLLIYCLFLDYEVCSSFQTAAILLCFSSPNEHNSVCPGVTYASSLITPHRREQHILSFPSPPPSHNSPQFIAWYFGSLLSATVLPRPLPIFRKLKSIFLCSALALL